MQIREKKKKARRSCQAKVANPFKKGPRAGLQWQAHMHGPLFLRKANVVKTHIFLKKKRYAREHIIYICSDSNHYCDLKLRPSSFFNLKT
jgi:hypothetical protein